MLKAMTIALTLLLIVTATIWAQSEPTSAGSEQHHKFDLAKLRREAIAKHEILRVTFFPDVDSADIGKLYDVGHLIEVEFVPVSKAPK